MALCAHIIGLVCSTEGSKREGVRTHLLVTNIQPIYLEPVLVMMNVITGRVPKKNTSLLFAFAVEDICDFAVSQSAFLATITTATCLRWTQDSHA